ncbi:MAG: hypothetical protein Q4B68_04255 [Bacteroidales bacterium]|nr:hypothetical protein [Bacteroidales bacterium]
MAEVDYKNIFNQVKTYVGHKYDYTKLTVAEKLSVLLARVVLVAIAFLMGFSVLLLLSGALVNVLGGALGNSALAFAIVAAIWAVACLLVFVFKNALIVNPVTRFVTKLMFNPEDSSDNTK